jgi:hypothetical protein
VVDPVFKFLSEFGEFGQIEAKDFFEAFSVAETSVMENFNLIIKNFRLEISYGHLLAA